MERISLSYTVDEPTPQLTIEFESLSSRRSSVSQSDNQELQSNHTEPGTSSEIFDPDDHRNYPEGGLTAYLVSLGGFTGTVVCMGLINSIGAIQAYVSINQLKDTDPIAISFIFAVYLSLAYSMGVVAGPIFDIYGAKVLLIVSNLLMFAGLMGSASSKQLWQFILSFISLGIGNGIGLTPIVSAPNHWFLRKRGLITGIVTAGGSFGGLVFPMLLRHTFDKLGYVSSLRILAAICFGCMTISLVLIKTRFTRPRESLSIKDITWSKFIKLCKDFLNRHNDSRFIFVILGSFCTELAQVELVTYFVSFFIAQGIPISTCYILLTVWNGLSIAGRIIPGYASDSLGKFNVNILMISALIVCFFTMWLPFGGNVKVMYLFAVLGGFFLGLILSMLPTCLSQITVVSQLGERYGVLNFILSIGNLVGVPIGVAIIGEGSVARYKVFVVFVGALSIAGTLFYIGARLVIVGARINVKV